MKYLSSVVSMFRNLLSAFILITWWVLALYGLIIKKAPDMKVEFDKVVPYQWFLGIILLLMWIRDFIHIFDILNTFSVSIFWWFLWLASLVTKLVLWFVLSFWLITKYVLSIQPAWAKKKWRKKKWEETWQEKTNKMYTTLTYVQVPFGVVALLLWLIALVFMFIWLVT